MSEYLWINILILCVPLLASFERRIAFYKRWPAVFGAIAIISPVYILWDIVATERGDWAFSVAHTLGMRVFGLPVEEILFFITVPYSCLFLYASLRYFLKERDVPFNRMFYNGLAVFLLVLAWMFRYQSYTCTDLLFAAVFFGVVSRSSVNILRSRIYWIFIAASFLPFLAFNGWLTSVPIVSYGDFAFSGFRLGTIPIEDFLYSFIMLSLYAWVYRRLGGK